MDKRFEAIRVPSRSRSGGEDDLNCLGEAQLLARLAENARRLEIIERFRRDLSSAQITPSRHLA